MYEISFSYLRISWKENGFSVCAFLFLPYSICYKLLRFFMNSYYFSFLETGRKVADSFTGG